MKYMLLIHQGDTPTPNSPDDWARLSEDAQKQVYADYRAIDETPGVSPGVQMQPPEAATTVRVQDGQDPDHRRAVRHRQGGARRLSVLRGGRPRRGDRPGRAHPGGAPGRRGRGASAGGAVAILEQVFRDEFGARRGGRGRDRTRLDARLDRDLDRYHYPHATRAELLRRLGRDGEARAAYDRALERVRSDAERRFLERRLAELPDR